MADIYNEIQKMKANEKCFIEYVVFLAKMNTLYFEEMVRRGFHPDAALKLTEAHGAKLFNGEADRR